MQDGVKWGLLGKPVFSKMDQFSEKLQYICPKRVRNIFGKFIPFGEDMLPTNSGVSARVTETTGMVSKLKYELKHLLS